MDAAAAMLVRPDGYVAWAADLGTTDEVDRLRIALTRWFGRARSDIQAVLATM